MIAPLFVVSLLLLFVDADGGRVILNGKAESGSEDHEKRPNERTLNNVFSDKPNLLFIMTDQQRFDTLRRAQDELPGYDNKLKIRTPHLDRLADMGVYFRNAYCSCPSCSPSRATLRTGCSMERTGVQGNKLKELTQMKLFTDKFDKLETYEQVLVEKQGYVAETYGKWHLPLRLYETKDTSSSVIQYNDYDFESSQSNLDTQDSWTRIYRKRLVYLAQLHDITAEYSKGQQENPQSQFPYDPIRLDSRYGKDTNTPLDGGFSNVLGRDSLATNFSSTTLLTDMSLRAMERLAASTKPFSLTVSYNNPHPPMVAAPEFYKYYDDNKAQLFVPPTMQDSGANSAYASSRRRSTKSYNTLNVNEWTACYYAMIEEVDEHVGRLVDKLDELGVAEQTLVIFTSDHGEMLSAHSMSGKSNFYEEATRVPLLMAFPGQIAEEVTVDQPVGHIDVFATILDYLGASHLDQSDGKSLRCVIEGTCSNKDYDERVVVGERDSRVPISSTELSGKLGDEPNFMIRKDRYKLLLPKKADSSTLDMMFDLETDPYEKTNLLGENGSDASNLIVGKAEHLKILLLEWMKRNDGDDKHYSDNKYNLGEGAGDIAEIRNRRTWRTVDFWQSDEKLSFGRPALENGAFVRSEYLYVGRSNSGTLAVNSVAVKGQHASYFQVATQSYNDYVRIKVTFSSTDLLTTVYPFVDAYIEIENDATGTSTAQIVTEPIETIPGVPTTLAPTARPVPEPTAGPTTVPTAQLDPTQAPVAPVAAPTVQTDPPTPVPTATPIDTAEPTATPTAAPTATTTTTPTAESVPTQAPVSPVSTPTVQTEPTTSSPTSRPSGTAVPSETPVTGPTVESNLTQAPVAPVTIPTVETMPTKAPLMMPTVVIMPEPTRLPTAITTVSGGAVIPGSVGKTTCALLGNLFAVLLAIYI